MANRWRLGTFVATIETTPCFLNTIQVLAKCEHGSSNLRGTQASKALLTHFPYSPNDFTNSEIVNVFNQVTAEPGSPVCLPRQDLFGINKTLALQAIPDFGSVRHDQVLAKLFTDVV